MVSGALAGHAIERQNLCQGGFRDATFCSTRRRHAISLAAGLFLTGYSCFPRALAEAATRQYWAERSGQPPLTPPIVADWVSHRRGRQARRGQRSAQLARRAGTGLPQMGRVPQAGRGSGFIITVRRLHLTNNHVVDGATAVQVRLDDGRELDAKVVGRDPQTDLALLKSTRPTFR